MAKGGASESSAIEPKLDRAMAYIRRHFARPVTLQDLARAVGLSPFHLHRQFRRHFGQTPKEVATRLQVEKAKGLILKGVPLSDVARRCGFSHQSHFASRFKMKTGLTARAWLKREVAKKAASRAVAE